MCSRAKDAQQAPANKAVHDYNACGKCGLAQVKYEPQLRGKDEETNPCNDLTGGGSEWRSVTA